jgi:peptide/nickel transport system permease protein
MRQIATRLLRLVVVLFLVTLATFLMIELLPGDPGTALLGENATPEQIERVNQELGLDQPLIRRYLDWLGDTVSGDLGQSFIPPNAEVSDMIRTRMPVTLQLVLMSTVMALLVSIPLALATAYRAGGRLDRVASSMAFAAISTPAFLVALLLVFFAVFHPDLVRGSWLVGGLALATWLGYRAVVNRDDRPPGPQRTRHVVVRLAVAGLVAAVTVGMFLVFPEFPRQGFEPLTGGEGIGTNLRHALLPALTLAIGEIAVFMRLLRSDLISTLQEDYILAARAKGMPPRRIMLLDALRPSSFSLMTVVGVSFARLVGGTVIIETIFNIPGMGRLVVDSITAKDIRVVQSAVLVIAVFYVTINLIVDIAYSYLDPRLRRGSV